MLSSIFKTKNNQRLLLLAFAFIFGGCATQQITIQSNPSGADVEIKNKPVGKTPLTLPVSEYTKYLEGDLIYFSIKKDGYVSKDLFLQPQGIAEYNFQMVRIAAEDLKTLPVQYASVINEMSREILTIQGLIFANNMEEAKAKLYEFEKAYPNIAAVSTLKASIEITKENYEDAYTYLLTAQKLDPNDQQVQRMLTAVKSRRREPASGK